MSYYVRTYYVLLCPLLLFVFTGAISLADGTFASTTITSTTNATATTTTATTTTTTTQPVIVQLLLLLPLLLPLFFPWREKKTRKMLYLVVT